MKYPKRLIEVDLPIKRISAHARREKSIRHGHISTLHIWWARRPLAACRAVLCASLWIDPVDELCPQKFRDDATNLINAFAKKAASEIDLREHCSEDIWAKWNAVAKNKLDSKNPTHLNILRFALLDFIADFANWDNSTQKDYLETARALTQSSHEALGGLPGTRPLVVDPFAGGGSIPLEALRVGGDAFASDLNPVAVLLNKVVLEYIPKYGQKLADEVRKWGNWIKEQAEKELGEFYPKDEDGSTPIAYLWARTIKCEGPGCGAEVPLMRSLWLVKKSNKSVALQIIPNPKEKKVDFEIIKKDGKKWIKQDNPEIEVKNPSFEGTVKRGSTTCPCCGFTTPVTSARTQLRGRKGGTDDARMYTVVLIENDSLNKKYRLPNPKDIISIIHSKKKIISIQNDESNSLSISKIPNEPLLSDGALGFRVQKYGITKWCDLFMSRQLLALIYYSNYFHKVSVLTHINELNIILLALGKISQNMSSVTRWRSDVERTEGAFSMQTLQMVWDFAEVNPLYENYPINQINLIEKIIEHINASNIFPGNAEMMDASQNKLPDDSVSYFFTDPPYYDAISYADLSDFFYIWLRRGTENLLTNIFKDDLTPKVQQAIMNKYELDENNNKKDAKNYENKMQSAFNNSRRILIPHGIATIVFAHKSTSGWENLIEATLKAGWVITGSWPIDTEMSSRMRAMDSAALASSVHLVCRPRENEDGSVTEEIGDWREVLTELPKRIADWMPRLASEGVVGADAIFACIGPALEIFSRYSKVEKTNGDVVTLREYLEQVWAAVAKEALKLILKDSDSLGFEEDARLTAIWLWTLSTNGNGKSKDNEDEEVQDEDDEESKPKGKLSGFLLEYDAARKIAQGLGAHLEKLSHLVEVKGDKARLLPVSERMKYLFGKDNQALQAKPQKKEVQSNLFKEMDEVMKQEYKIEIDTGDSGFTAGKTVLDKVHQSMLLFASGRTEALKRMLIEEGVGRDTRYWKLAQSLSALYPSTTDEKRWVDGVLAKKKGFGF